MNRKEAQNHIGKLVLIDEAVNGRYIGKLIEVHAEPRKPWRGEVEILAVDTYPYHFVNKDGVIELPEPAFHYGMIAEFHSSKIESFPEENYKKYEDSIYEALQVQIDKIQSERGYLNDVLKVLHDRLADIKPVETVTETKPHQQDDSELTNDYIYYTVKKEQGEFVLIETNSQQDLVLEGCPFEFEIHIDGEWFPGYYGGNGEFEGIDGSSYSLTEKHEVRLHKKQFDPYHILMNELEKPALQALEKGLAAYGMKHEQCVQCHNTLLIQLLNTNQQTKFKGANFITYHNGREVVLVQHHYEREIMEDDNDITFDRFEFTSDHGKRTITSYSNEFSKGK